jgi:hypothetical protein
MLCIQLLASYHTCIHDPYLEGNNGTDRPSVGRGRLGLDEWIPGEISRPDPVSIEHISPVRVADTESCTGPDGCCTDREELWYSGLPSVSRGVDF